MNTFQTIIQNNIKKNLESGDYFYKDEKLKKDIPTCKHCKKDKQPTEVKRWGKQKPAIYEWRCDCVQEKAERVSMAMTEYSLVEEESKLNVVVLVYGIAMYITEEEKLSYLEEMNKNSKAIMIVRDYILDKIYPMMPKDEYERQKHKFE